MIITLLLPAVSLLVRFNSSRCLPPWSLSLPPTLFASIGSLVYPTALARTRGGGLNRVGAILEEREMLRAIPFQVIFFLFFLYLILSHSLIAFAPLDLADTDHHDAITWLHLLSPNGYEDR